MLKIIARAKVDARAMLVVQFRKSATVPVFVRFSSVLSFE